MEQFQSVAVPRSTVDYLEGTIEKIHSTIDGLNALYESAQSPAETPREVALSAALARLVHCPDLNLEDLDPETCAAIDTAKRLLYPDVS